MRLSEAIQYGSTLREESHQERFVRMADGTLRSDVWGAACEAVSPEVARLNWDARDKFKFENSMHTLRAVQDRYFGSYFRMPAVCPGANQAIVRARGRYARPGELKIESGQKAQLIGGVTTECERVKQLAGLIDHLFYAHGWSREKCAEAVKWYENRMAFGSLMLGRKFQHYAVN